MSAGQLHLTAPPQIQDHLQAGSLARSLQLVAGLGQAELLVLEADAEPTRPGAACIPITYQDQALGSITCSSLDDASKTAADAIHGFLEHALERELVIADFADQLFVSYEELNLIYRLLPSIATKSSEREIGEVLVQQTSDILQCDRVSLLVFDETAGSLRVLASRGLPPEARNVEIPIVGSLSGQVLLGDEEMLMGDMSRDTELAAMSKGSYDGNAFALVRVPLRARGEYIGVLTATNRRTADEFTARDRKLLASVSAMGASALMHCRLHTNLHRQMLGTIKALAHAVDAKDHYIHDHSSRVGELCVAIAREMDVGDQAVLRQIELAGLLHDVGKIGIPDSILSKQQSLTREEFEIIKTHVQIGAGIVNKVGGLEEVARAIQHHHERYDGLGYLAGLAADEIPLASRLIAVADTFDSLTSDRSYRKAMPRTTAYREIRAQTGTQFDPAVVEAFERTQGGCE